MFIYCICSQYLVEAPFALITASIRRGMEVISFWHCWGGMEAQVSLTVAFSSSAFFGLLFLIYFLTILYIDSLWQRFSIPVLKFLNRFYLTILIRLRFSRLVVHLFLPLNFLLTCLDTALCEQPASLAMNVCGLPSLWRVSMIVFWTTVRSTVFPMIV